MAQLAVIANGTGPPARPVMVRRPSEKRQIGEAIKPKPITAAQVSVIHRTLSRESFESDVEYAAYLKVMGVSLPLSRVKEVLEVATAASPTSRSSSEAQRYERWLRNEAPLGYTKGVQTRGEVTTVYDDADGKQRQLILNRRSDEWVDPKRKEFYTVPKLKGSGVHRVEIPNYQYMMVTWIGSTQREDQVAWQRARKRAVRRTESSQVRRRARHRQETTANLNAIRAGATIPLPKVTAEWHEQTCTPEVVRNLWEYSRTDRLLRGEDPIGVDLSDSDIPWEYVSGVPGKRRDPEPEPLESKPVLDREVIVVNSQGLATPALPKVANDSNLVTDLIGAWERMPEYPFKADAWKWNGSCRKCGAHEDYVMCSEDGPLAMYCTHCFHEFRPCGFDFENWSVKDILQLPKRKVEEPVEIHRGNVDEYDPSKECPVCDAAMQISHGANRCVGCGFIDDAVVDVPFDITIDLTNRSTAMKQLQAVKRKILENLNVVDQQIQYLEDKDLVDEVARRRKITTRAQYRAVMRDADLADKELRARFARKYPRMKWEHERDVRATAIVFGAPGKRRYIFRRNQRRMNEAKRLGIWLTVVKAGKGMVGTQFSKHLQHTLRLHARWLLTGTKAEMHPNMRSRLSPFERWVHNVGDTTHTPTMKKRALLGIYSVELPAPQPVFKDGEVIGFVKTAHSYAYDMEGAVKPMVPASKPVPKRTFLGRVGEFIRSPSKGFPSARSKRNSIERTKYLPSARMRQWLADTASEEARYKAYWRGASSVRHFEDISKVGPAPKGVRNVEAMYDEETALVLAYQYVPPPEPVAPGTEEEIKKVSDLVDTISEYSLAIFMSGAESEEYLRKHNRELKRFLNNVVLVGSGQSELSGNEERPRIEIARVVPR